MSLNASMQIAVNGLNVFRSATAVVSQNISNVSTPGYTRQKAIVETAPTINLSGFTLGSGAMISKIERFHDALLQQQLANSNTTLGYDTAKSTVLQQIEPAFNDIGTDGVGASLAHFFAAWQDLTNNPGGFAERQSVLSNAQILADDLHAASKTLTDMISLQNDSLAPVIDDINIKLKEIARLNQQVTTTEMVSGNANEVKDKRDLLLLQLAKQVGITSTENSDGTVDVKLVGSGKVLVTGANAGAFSLDKTDPNSYKVELIPAKGTIVDITDITATLSTGSLGATLALRDDIIPNDYLKKLNTLATSLAEKINAKHKEGYDLSDPPVLGKDFFMPFTKDKTGSIDDGTNIVKNVDVTGLRVGMEVTGVAADRKIFIGSIIDTGDPLTSSFTLVDANRVSFNVSPAVSTFTFPDASASAFFSIDPLMTTATIAASSPGTLAGTSSGDNLKAVEIAGFANQRLMDGNLTFNGYWNALISKMGLDVNSSKTNVAQDEAFNNQLNVLKDSTAGVSLDQELSDMIMYQRSYQACAKVISTAADMMDTILGIVR